MMSGCYTRCDEEKGVLENLINFFAAEVPHLQEVKLNKLIYIAHLYHYADHGRLMTRTRFFSLGYGPHAPAIRPVLKDQLETNGVFLVESRTSADPVYSNPCLIIKSSRQRPGNLPEAYLNTMEGVVEDWGQKEFPWILDYTTRTFPYLATTYREHIDFRFMEPVPALKQILPRSQRARLHRFVKTPEDVRDERFDFGVPGTISAGEVAEIYLALCGNLPDKIPDRNHLGFKPQAVINAIRSTENCTPDSMAEPVTPVDLAARLAYALVDSMSFKSYSGRVALKSGMLFLKKNGYHFNGDVLEKSWPQSYFYTTLREWFQSVDIRSDAENTHPSKRKQPVGPERRK